MDCVCDLFGYVTELHKKKITQKGNRSCGCRHRHCDHRFALLGKQWVKSHICCGASHTHLCAHQPKQIKNRKLILLLISDLEFIFTNMQHPAAAVAATPFIIRWTIISAEVDPRIDKELIFASNFIFIDQVKRRTIIFYSCQPRDDIRDRIGVG